MLLKVWVLKYMYLFYICKYKNYLNIYYLVYIYTILYFLDKMPLRRSAELAGTISRHQNTAFYEQLDSDPTSAPLST